MHQTRVSSAMLDGLIDGFLSVVETTPVFGPDPAAQEYAATCETTVAALRELRAARVTVLDDVKDAFESGYIQGHEATIEGRYNLVGATADYLAAVPDAANE